MRDHLLVAPSTPTPRPPPGSPPLRRPGDRRACDPPHPPAPARQHRPAPNRSPEESRKPLMPATKTAVTAAVAFMLPVVLLAAAAAGVAAVFTGSSGAGCDPAGPTPTATTPVSAVAGYGPDQIANAATIGRQMNIPEQGQVIAITAAIQESGLHNLDHGDRDSLGLFQQRPSQGWGTPTQIMNPAYAAGRFYAALMRVRGWQSMPLTVAAQDV